MTLIIDADGDVLPACRDSRARVAAASQTDDNMDRLIKQAQRGVEQWASADFGSVWRVACMAEPALGIAGGDGREGVGDGLFERLA